MKHKDDDSAMVVERDCLRRDTTPASRGDLYPSLNQALVAVEAQGQEMQVNGAMVAEEDHRSRSVTPPIPNHPPGIIDLTLDDEEVYREERDDAYYLGFDEEEGYEEDHDDDGAMEVDEDEDHHETSSSLLAHSSQPVNDGTLDHQEWNEGIDDDEALGVNSNAGVKSIVAPEVQRTRLRKVGHAPCSECGQFIRCALTVRPLKSNLYLTGARKNTRWYRSPDSPNTVCQPCYRRRQMAETVRQEHVPCANCRTPVPNSEMYA